MNAKSRQLISLGCYLLLVVFVSPVWSTPTFVFYLSRATSSYYTFIIIFIDQTICNFLESTPYMHLYWSYHANYKGFKNRSIMVSRAGLSERNWGLGERLAVLAIVLPRMVIKQGWIPELLLILVCVTWSTAQSWLQTISHRGRTIPVDTNFCAWEFIQTLL